MKEIKNKGVLRKIEKRPSHQDVRLITTTGDEEI